MSHTCKGCGAEYTDFLCHRCYELLTEDRLHTPEQNRMAAFNRSSAKPTATAEIEAYVVVYRKVQDGRLDVTLHSTETDAQRFIEMFTQRPDRWEIILEGWRLVASDATLSAEGDQ